MAVDSVLPLVRTNSAPHEARLFVEQRLGHISPTVCQDVVLLVSELVTNVVRHGAEPAHLHLAVDATAVTVGVHDSGPELPADSAAALPDTRSSSGRGLIIVAALARHWGVRTDDRQPGKEVWFDVAL